MDRIVFSFIIPHKNCPKLLNRCINSIPEREDVQIIIVDDNSDADKKPKISRHNTEVVFLDADRSKGAGRARNIGLREAKGKWLLFADADDYYSDKLNEFLDNYIDSNSDAIYFGYMKISQNGQTINPDYNHVLYSAISNPDVDILYRYFLNAPWNKMVRSELLKKYNIVFEESISGNDIFYSYQLGTAAKTVSIEKSIIYYYNYNPNSLVHKKKNSKEKHLCRLLHTCQMNVAKSLLGYPQLKTSLLKYFIYELKTNGVRNFSLSIYVAIKNYNYIRNNKGELYNMILRVERIKQLT